MRCGRFMPSRRDRDSDTENSRRLCSFTSVVHGGLIALYMAGDCGSRVTDI